MSRSLPWREACDAGELVVALVRHGRTEWNASRRFLGATDVPLDEVGRAEADALAAAFPGAFDHVYSSPLLRAFDTARRLHPEPREIPALAEMDLGELEGLYGPEAIERYGGFFDAWNRDPSAVCPPSGESLPECQARALSALDAIAADHAPGEALAVVTHQLVIASVTCAVLDRPLRAWRDHGVRNTAVTGLAWRDRRWRVLFEDWLPGEDGGSLPRIV